MKISTLKRHKHAQLWFVRFNGRNKYLGNRQTSQEEAQQMLDQLRLEQTINKASPQVNESEQTITGLLQYYLKHQCQATTQNMRDRHRYCTQFQEAFGSLTVKQLKPHFVQSWLDKQTTWNSTTRCNALKHLSAAFNWLVINDLISRSPLKGVKRPLPLVRGEEFILTQEEYNRVLKLVSRIYKPIVELMWHTGARPSEILTATAEEYNPDTHEIVKIHHKTEGKGKTRRILLNDRADEIVANRSSIVKRGLLFRSIHGKPIACDILQQYMRRRFDDAGITHPVCDYSFRHSAAVRWIEGGIPLHVVSAWLGNSQRICYETYAHCLERVRNTRHLLPN